VEKVYELYIRATPEELWQAITDPEIRRHYQFGAGAYSDWAPGSRVELRAGDRRLGDGDVLEVEPPRRLVHTMVAQWSEAVASDGASRVTWTIEPVGDSCHLVVVHDYLHEDSHPEVYGGWPMILSGLKTWLETGRPLTTPGSLRWG
jgi:uncharacterized protein YndB with AHSA1/START domain